MSIMIEEKSINIYCDESCHLFHDKSNVMGIGGILINSENEKSFKEAFRNLKTKYDLSRKWELKWTKLSARYIDFYKEVIDLFQKTRNIGYRGVICKSKTANKFRSLTTYNTWYQKMYYLLLNKVIDFNISYRIFIDKKDTLGKEKCASLTKILRYSKYDFFEEQIHDIEEINSDCNDFIQLADFFTGALTFFHRGLHLSDKSSNAKKEIVQYLKNKYKLENTTKLYERKFNIVILEVHKK